MRIKILCYLQCWDFYCLVTFQICVYLEEIRAFIHLFFFVCCIYILHHIYCVCDIHWHHYMNARKYWPPSKILTGSRNQNIISKSQMWPPFVEVTTSKANTHKNLPHWYVTSQYICSATHFNFTERVQRNSLGLISVVFSKNINSIFILLWTLLDQL